MNQFISTHFFFSLKKALQMDIDIDIQVLENNYEEFAASLFLESTATDKATYHNILTYTLVELANIAEVLKKKCHYFSWKSYPVDLQTN